MAAMMIPPNAMRCDLCGKCVEVAVTGNELALDAPSFHSDCDRQECPVNAANRPGAIDNVAIYFVADGACN